MGRQMTRAHQVTGNICLIVLLCVCVCVCARSANSNTREQPWAKLGKRQEEAIGEDGSEILHLEMGISRINI